MLCSMRSQRYKRVFVLRARDVVRNAVRDATCDVACEVVRDAVLDAIPAV